MVRGGNEYDQKTLCEILKELIKIKNIVTGRYEHACRSVYARAHTHKHTHTNRRSRDKYM